MNNKITKIAQGLIIGVAIFCGAAHAALNDCDLVISQVQMNYGKLNKATHSFQMTPQGNVTALDKRTMSIIVTCPQEEHIKLQFSGAKTSDQQFAFGQNGGIKFTLYEVTLDNSLVVTRDVTPGVTDSSPLNSRAIKPDAIIAAGQNETATGKTFAAMVDVEPILGENAFNMQDAQKLMAQLHVSLEE